MKSLILFFGLFISFPTISQTTIYFANADGTIDKNSYRHIIEATGLVITHDKTTLFANDTAYNFILSVNANSINCDFLDPSTKKVKGPQGCLGRLDADKKIIEYSAESNNHDRCPSYIKDSKIYSFDNKVLAFIQGQEIYGVALWLLNN
ncbi:MAG: hypothetical protein PSX36_14460 [bacterium]|nr:hypothetical protein [bacterium]